MAWKQAQRQGEERVTLWITLSDRELGDITKTIKGLPHILRAKVW